MAAAVNSWPGRRMGRGPSQEHSEVFTRITLNACSCSYLAFQSAQNSHTSRWTSTPELDQLTQIYRFIFCWEHYNVSLTHLSVCKHAKTYSVMRHSALSKRLPSAVNFWPSVICMCLFTKHSNTAFNRPDVFASSVWLITEQFWAQCKQVNKQTCVYKHLWGGKLFL